MEVNLGFCGYHGYQIAFFRTITAAESQDCVVPDTLPDIASIMYTSGCVLIRSKDVSDGHIRMEANVPARVFCRGDGERQDFCLDVNIPFYLSAEDDAITEGSVCTAALKLRHLETRMLNPRKVSVRAEISVDLTCYSEENVLFCTAPEEDSGNIHVLEQETELTAIESITEKTFVLTDEYELPSDRSSAAEIISQDADIIVQELRSVGSKLILKGTARSALICRMENGEPEQLCFQTAFSQIIETETGTEDALFGTQMMMSGMYYELTPGADGRSISMELHLVAQVAVYVRRRIRYLSDVYSNAYALKMERVNRTLLLYDKEITIRDTCSTTVDTAGEVSGVIACRATAMEWSCSGDEISVQLMLRLCWRSGDKICSTERLIQSKVKQEAIKCALRLLDVTVQDVHASCSATGIELRIPLEIRGFAVQSSEETCIEHVEYDESAPLDLEDKPTLVVLYPGYSGDLWTLAKENCSTTDAICAANDISDGILHTDRLLLIPKSV